MRRRLIVLALLLLGIGLGLYVYSKKNESQPTSSSPVTSQTSNETKPAPPFIDVQPVVEAWDAQAPGKASVVVYDLANKRTAASINPDSEYFTASIYKLYVAYEGYKKVADGTHSLDSPYLSGYTRGKCLDAMIRDSYSPCSEKMWAELGKDNLTQRMKAYGLTNTSLVGLYTSARDAAAILQRLYERSDLNDEHTNLFLDSLKTQDAKYRRGLPQGFSAGTTVHNKVGWNEQIEWHDTAIITLEDERSYVISVFTERVGVNNIISLAKSIETKLVE